MGALIDDLLVLAHQGESADPAEPAGLLELTGAEFLE